MLFGFQFAIGFIAGIAFLVLAIALLVRASETIPRLCRAWKIDSLGLGIALIFLALLMFIGTLPK
jgi:hypothetical protein